MKLGRLASQDQHAVPHRLRQARILAAVLTVTLCVAAAQDEAQARPSRSTKHAAKATTAKAAGSRNALADRAITNSIEPGGVWTAGEDERTCFHGRRKLWQNGRGWIVKRVTICP